MTHLGWILPAIGGYLGGILSVLYGHAGKYSLDKANELKELILKIKREIEALEGPPREIRATGYLDVNRNQTTTTSCVWVYEDFSKYASEVDSKLELIRWRYGWIRHLHLVALPPKKKVEEVAKLLRQIPQGEKITDPPQPRESLVIAEKIKKLLDP